MGDLLELVVMQLAKRSVLEHVKAASAKRRITVMTRKACLVPFAS